MVELRQAGTDTIDHLIDKANLESFVTLISRPTEFNFIFERKNT